MARMTTKTAPTPDTTRTPGDPRGVFFDLFDADTAVELTMRGELLIALERWLAASGQTQAQAAKVLGVTQARVSNIKRGKFSEFSLEQLVKLAARAGLKPQLGWPTRIEIAHKLTPSGLRPTH